MTWAPDYCQVEDLKDYVQIADAADDVQIALAVAAASRAVDRACNRQFGKDALPTARYYTARWDPQRCRWVVPIDDLMDTASVQVMVDTPGDLTFPTEVTGFRPLPLNAAAAGRPFTELLITAANVSGLRGREDAVEVTAMFGWDEVPDAIVQATLLQASRFLARRNSPFGVAGSPDTGSEMRLLAKVDPDVEVTLAPYRRWWGAC